MQGFDTRPDGGGQPIYNFNWAAYYNPITPAQYASFHRLCLSPIPIPRTAWGAYS